MRCFKFHAASAILFFAASLGTVSTSTGDDELFSSVAMDSVFSASASKKNEISQKELKEKADRESRLKKLAALFEPAEVGQPSASAAPQSSLRLSTLLGRWSATLSKDQIFAIEFTKENKFNLVHLGNGKSTLSSGTFSIAGNQLTLKSKAAAPLVSEIKRVSSDLFQMKLGQSQLSFKRAK